jgi:hypothetical protein
MDETTSKMSLINLKKWCNNAKSSLKYFVLKEEENFCTGGISELEISAIT